MSYVTVQSKLDGVDAVKFTDGPYADIVVMFGKITLKEMKEEDDGGATLHIKYDYEVLDWAGKKVSDLVPFENALGGILQEMIVKGLEENTLTYTGGTDGENGTDNNQQPAEKP